jgi:hypothetical protein
MFGASFVRVARNPPEAGTANAVRLALRRQTHCQPHADAFG